MSDTKITYVKALTTDPDMSALASATQLSVKDVVAITNQSRYRTAYNKLTQQRMKVVRRLVKEHPELLAASEREGK